MDRTEWPKWMYGPGDERRIFQKDDQVPKGWEDHPDKVQAPEKSGESRRKQEKKQEPSNVPEPTPEEKADTIREIREAAAEKGIDVQLTDDASVEEINAAIDKLTKE